METRRRNRSWAWIRPPDLKPEGGFAGRLRRTRLHETAREVVEECDERDECLPMMKKSASPG